VFLVTGGAGFIGSHLVGHLVERGLRVRIVDNFATGDRANAELHGPGVEVLEGDLQDPRVARAAVDGAEVVFHLAALGSVPRSFKDAWGSHDANVNATVRLLEAARDAGVRRVVYSSSSSVYGDTPVLPKHEALEPLPRSPYAASKLAGEQYVLAYARAGLVEGVALRYFNVFGPRQRPDGPYAAVIPLLMAAAAAGAPMRVHGDGAQTRDFTYVENVVRANWLAATGPAEQVSGWAVNVGAGARTSLLELIAAASETTGRPIAVEHGPPRPGDVRDSLASLDRVRHVLGYTPTVSVRVGRARTWAAFPRPAAAGAVR
jgi:UDP-glucose 4-epimerase